MTDRQLQEVVLHLRNAVKHNFRNTFIQYNVDPALPDQVWLVYLSKRLAYPESVIKEFYEYVVKDRKPCDVKYDDPTYDIINKLMN